MPLMKAELVVEPFANGWCVRLPGASTPSFMNDDLTATREWAAELAKRLGAHRIEVHDRWGRLTEILSI